MNPNSSIPVLIRVSWNPAFALVSLRILLTHSIWSVLPHDAFMSAGSLVFSPELIFHLSEIPHRRQGITLIHKESFASQMFDQNGCQAQTSVCLIVALPNTIHMQIRSSAGETGISAASTPQQSFQEDKTLQIVCVILPGRVWEWRINSRTRSGDVWRHQPDSNIS